MRFHCSLKLLKVLEKSSSLSNVAMLPVHSVEKKDDQDELYDWHASIVEENDVYIATFTNDLTGFPIVVGLLDIESIHEVFVYFKTVLAEVMVKQKIDKQIILDYLKKIEPSILTKTISRAKTGPLSAVTIEASNLLYEGVFTHFDPVELSVSLSETPRVKKGTAYFPVDQWFDAWNERLDPEPIHGQEIENQEKFGQDGRPTKEDWLAFYQILEKIKKAAPWRRMYDDEIIAVMDPDINEWSYCSIMGRLGDYFGIGVFVGPEGLNSLMKVYSTNIFVPGYQLKTIQNCSIVSFINRAEINQENYNRLKHLELYHNEYYLLPEVLKHTPGYAPWHEYSQDEIQWLTVVLDQVLKVTNKLSYGDSLPRLVDKIATGRIKQNINWKTVELQLPESTDLQHDEIPYPFKNEIAIYQIKNAPKTNQSIQLDAVHAPAIIQESKEQRPYYPMIAICVDEKRMEILNAKTYPKTDKSPKEILDCLTEVCQQGRPKELIIRKNTIEWVVKEFCQKTGIKMRVRDRLIELDEVMDHMERDMG